jgi:hypothetical protein
MASPARYPIYGLPSGIAALGKVLICLVQKWVFGFAKMTDRSRRLTYPRGDVGCRVAADAGSLSRDLLILDVWGLAPLTGEQRRDLLEVVDDRHQRGSTIITSHVPIEHWHEVIADPTIADAVLDRLVHNAHRLALKGDSMRKITAQRANLDAAKKN